MKTMTYVSSGNGAEAWYANDELYSQGFGFSLNNDILNTASEEFDGIKVTGVSYSCLEDEDGPVWEEFGYVFPESLKELIRICEKYEVEDET